MAYMSQEIKKSLSVNIKAVLKKYKVKGSIQVRNHSTIIVTLRQSSFDFDLKGDWDYMRINHHTIDRNFDGEQREFLESLHAAMMGNEEHQNHNNSDVMTDYFDVGWYTEITVGDYNKPYTKV